ncbi:MAG TPA: SDR family NAD(P)-dependent oxidoreductase [Nocardioides sp.]|nr:SDR family NAD(P)-dependent oxidoreductase [Nocardioides sp.]
MVRNVVVQGGTDGIGRELAVSCLRAGDRVLVLGRSEAKGAQLVRIAEDLGAVDRLAFVAADLSAICENLRVIEEIRSEMDQIDALVLCARHYHSTRQESVDGVEATFALFYLSRFLLCHGLVGHLRGAKTSVVVNVAGPGGSLDLLNWGDPGLTAGYAGQRALAQCGVANDLLGVAFSEKHGDDGIRYVLVDPGMTSTNFSGDYDPATAAQIEQMKQMGAPVAQTVRPIRELIDSRPNEPLSAFNAGRPIDVRTLPAFDVDAARRLSEIAHGILNQVAPGALSTIGVQA